jgi:4-hydroxy-2-oxoglutarate aldolase
VNLSGVILPLTTPFAGDAVDTAALAANVARFERHGLAGYLLLGSTGEAALLDEDEKLAVLRAARVAIPRDKVMLAGVGVESTRATVRLARKAGDAGADALLVLTPFFFRARMGADALRRHFEAVADAAPVPLLLYNVPGHTSLVIPPAVVGDLARHSNVAGLKDSSGDLPWLLDVLARVPAGFRVLCGSAAAFASELSAGAVGGILAVGNALPEPLVELHRRHLAGDAAGALALQKALIAPIRAIVNSFGIAGIKAAMDLRGLHGGAPRPPLQPLAAAELAELRAELDRLVAAELIAAPAL